jgi:hypothetical protein
MGRRAAFLAAAGATAVLTAAGTLTAPATAAPTRAAACGDGSYQAEAVQDGSNWTARRGSSTVYTGTDMRAAVQAAVNSLTSGRTSKERVVVRGSGSISAGSRIPPELHRPRRLRHHQRHRQRLRGPGAGLLPRHP